MRLDTVILYEREIEGTLCQLIEENHKLYTMIDEELKEVDGKIAEQNRCELLYDCLVGTAYMLYKTGKEIEEISFD